MKYLRVFAVIVSCIVLEFFIASCFGGLGGGQNASNNNQASSTIQTLGGSGGSSSSDDSSDNSSDNSEDNSEQDSWDSSVSKGTLITIKKADNSAYAVIVGENKYVSGLHLSQCVNDANDLKNSLTGSNFWSDSTVDQQNDKEVTKQMIIDAINNAKNYVNPGATFMFYFSGHGTKSGSTGYIVPFDGATSDGADLNYCISEDLLKSLLAGFDSSVKKVCYFDSCYSGEFINKLVRAKPNDGKIKYMPAKGTTGSLTENFGKSLADLSNCVVVTACSKDQYCQESSYLKNSVFTYYLVEGLGASGSVIGPADADSSLTISAEETYNYLKPKALDYNPSQEAQILDNYDFDLIVKN